MADDTNGKDVVAEGNGEIEGVEKKLKYPYSVFFIISNEFCERFNYYGMRTILALYLTRKLLFSDDVATILYHSFTTLVYFICIIGAIIADSWWGKFNTILWLSLVYVSGSTVLTLGAVENWKMPAKTFTFIGLALIAIGSGGIKPCVAAFGGEQFRMPQQAKQLALFFSLFYFSINAGSLLSTFVTPILREMECLGMDSCFPFGFGLPAILMAVSIVIFVAGKFMYRILPIQGNMLVKVFKCIGVSSKLFMDYFECNSKCLNCFQEAISTKKKEKDTNPREHWLEYAEPRFGKKLVMETKILLNVLVLYIPLPIFWALFDQQGSRWTFQATRMDGDLGWFTIKPDQMQVINPFLILTFIPLYELLFYPLLSLIGIRRPLQKITLGGIFAGVAFILSMVVEIAIEPTYPVLPKAGWSQLRMYNARNCDYNLYVNLDIENKNFNLSSNTFASDLWVPINGDSQNFDFLLTALSPGCDSYNGQGKLESGKANSFLLSGSGPTPSITTFEDDPDKSRQGKPIVRILANVGETTKISLRTKNGIEYEDTRANMNQTDITSTTYDILIGGTVVSTGHPMKTGGVYVVLAHEKSANTYEASVATVTGANSVNMLWLTPQVRTNLIYLECFKIQDFFKVLNF
ncbi:hypothetical protein ACKWTF_006659 [Chironomus riparius]